MSGAFAQRVLAWFDVHGRQHLPWQKAVTPYRVWVSEIMLQQTQVNTVIPYFERFMLRFPGIAALAAAPLDDVLHHWTGLGYYARARNLHKAAQQIMAEHAGALPADLEGLQQLPGIGRSTAGAILSLAGGRRAVILDGNVKRVLSRHVGEGGWPGTGAVMQRLWQLAEARTPQRRFAAYNQAMMDLGSLVCSRIRPACDACPVAVDCVAHASGRTQDYPGRKPRKALPQRAVRMLLVRDGAGAILLEQRPPSGVWGGLWSLPEIAADGDPLDWCGRVLRRGGERGRTLARRRHTFSHFHLDIEPVEILLTQPGSAVLEGAGRLWYNPAQPHDIGLAAPVVRLIDEIAGRTS